MKRNAIPYKIVGGMKFFDRAEVKDMLSYLCVLNNPLDDLRLRRIINTPARGIGATTIDKVSVIAAEQGASLYEIIRNADLFPELKSASSKLLKFADLIDNLRRAGGSLTLPEFYDAVCDQSGYIKALEEKNDMEAGDALKTCRNSSPTSWAFWPRGLRMPPFPDSSMRSPSIQTLTAWKPTTTASP